MVVAHLLYTYRPPDFGNAVRNEPIRLRKLGHSIQAVPSRSNGLSAVHSCSALWSLLIVPSVGMLSAKQLVDRTLLPAKSEIRPG
jgi:hypothetical protein